ncbi:GTP-binding protein [Niveomyces insectorum RCEF 264]|uniref:GTP-binding protein n=1 Tax=Niveomyces insectorum RCEF 264 TaxID=1081102 RepID=A0A168A0T8_9HYPO|nr:GTP-binding protein [Niveomyces insectorum RCEF 264]
MSVFTYDPNPPRVSSPWLRPADAEDERSTEPPHTQHAAAENAENTENTENGPPALSLLSEYGVIRLPPEPQDGPVEYKLHLLLRPRRTYSPAADTKFVPKARLAALSTAGQSRQDRCQQLTTQLLWRLRQSSPYHASVAHQDIVVPLLPEDAAIGALPVTLGKLAPGLEESQGALYEIGVADDGTLVGITRNELDQSVATLRWMAANLGCVTDVLREVVVGKREETDEPAALVQNNGTADVGSAAAAKRPADDCLWVAEVFVRPHLHVQKPGVGLPHPADVPAASSNGLHASSSHPTTLGSATANQLRVTLTGPTGSGKSTLLGTLSTGALDDGHGKSRLNSLKHRHEMASGLTSTVTQELIGYCDDGIVNYANPNIESWIGIHDYAKNGRLVFLSDSAGHPRFRRTTLRGLIGWSPHWTLLCLAASSSDGATEPPAVDSSLLDAGTAAGSAALAKAHLDLCLKLDLPLAIIITKSDLLSKESLKRTLVPIWTAVKGVGRTPQLLQSKQRSPENVRFVSPSDAALIERALSHVRATGDTRATVPVVLASAVSGDGIGLVHALLRALPCPPRPVARDYIGMALNPEQPEALFHIEDRFSRPASYASAAGLGHVIDPGYVVSGYLRFGSLSVGDRVVLGPFPSDDDASPGACSDDDRTASPSHTGLSSSHPSGSELARIAARNAVPAAALKGEWHTARIVSIRNLRLPVRTLDAGQVGSIGLVVVPSEEEQQDDTGPYDAKRLPLPELKPRRGMVLAVPSRHMVDSGLQLQAASGLTAYFRNTSIGLLALGTPVTFYVASVRAQARIEKIWSAAPSEASGTEACQRKSLEQETAIDGGFFGIPEAADEAGRGDQSPSCQGYNVRLELLFGREWIELGSKIVLLEGASREGFLLDGFIGKVVEIVD